MGKTTPTGISVGLNKGHVTTVRELKPRPASRKGVRQSHARDRRFPGAAQANPGRASSSQGCPSARHRLGFGRGAWACPAEADTDRPRPGNPGRARAAAAWAATAPPHRPDMQGHMAATVGGVSPTRSFPCAGKPQEGVAARRVCHGGTPAGWERSEGVEIQLYRRRGRSSTPLAVPALPRGPLASFLAKKAGGGARVQCRAAADRDSYDSVGRRWPVRRRR